MRFSVRVPVLSEQMTVTEPSVSTAGSLRMRAWRLSMRWAPRARAMVTTAGRPSGTAATAMLMAVSSINCQSSPRSRPSTKTTATMTSAATASPLPNCSSRRCRGRLALHGLDQLGDAAQLGVHARGGDGCHAAAVGDHRAHIDHIPPVAHGAGPEVRSARAPGVFFHRLRLAGQGGFLDAQVDRLQQAAVGGHQRAGLQQHHVARHQLAGRDLDHVAVAPDLDRGHGQLFEGGHGLFGAVLLAEAQHGVEHDDGQDGDGVLPVAQRPETTAATMRMTTMSPVSCSHRMRHGLLRPRSTSSLGPNWPSRRFAVDVVRPVSASVSSADMTSCVSFRNQSDTVVF